MAKSSLIKVQCEEQFYLSLQEVIHAADASHEMILEIIDEGIVTPKTDKSKIWMFDNEAVHTIQIVSRLNHDLGINLAGAALILDLLKEIDTLRSITGNY